MAAVPGACAQHGKKFQDPFQVPGPGSAPRHQRQVLQHRQRREDPARFRQVGDAAPRDGVGSLTRDRLALEKDSTTPGANQAHDRLEGGLACPISTEQSDHAALLHLQGCTLQDVALATITMDVLDLQHQAVPTLPPPR